MKFTPAGGRVEVTLAATNHHAEITVRDNGKGIPAHFLPYVFDYFRQEDGASTRKFGGLGLGRAIVRHLVDNASFHRSQAMDEIVAQAECELWYLPPYSPDLNKIERWWFVLKNWMRQRWDEFETFRDCVDAAFRDSPNVLR
ncbi:transposase [Leptolyngbya sp. UWPOB_LEPTO1]|uniref:transposase n=1 Tax=Leptolyngbya sp. UWPOB_LEPTO1 TaxID=2815653 RepID=UPI0025794A46|nr:transposase [Leptolyngbya sp. UWPOB_LEPTO1]